MKTKKEIIKYLIVIPFVGSADLGIYYLLIRFLPNIFSKAISYVIANGAGYLFNKFWIFKRKRKQSAVPEASRYIILDLVLFGCNVMTNQIILKVWPKELWPKPVFTAIAVASLLTASLSFICKKFWVFRTSSV